MTQTPNIEHEMPKAYEPGKVEQKWYKFWLENGYFKPQIDTEKKPFVIIMPPPNVTGELHVGHALTATLEDIMTRWHRMKGEPTLWLPGVDHAGIATQVVLEQLLGDRELDFCLLMSSGSSFLGGLGFAAYSAANNFMDAFVYYYKRFHPYRWLSINWEVWQTGGAVDKSSDPGMGAVGDFLAVLKVKRK